MLDTGATFIRYWLGAARQIAHVIRLRALESSPAAHASPLVPVDGVRGLYRECADSYLYAIPWSPPYRLLGRPADVPQVLALERALRGIERIHGRISVLHGHFYAGTRLLPTVRRRMGLPYVVTEHSTALSGLNPDRTVSRVGLRIARRVYSSAARVMPVSQDLLSRIRRLGLPGRFEVLDNPVDISSFQIAQPYEGGTFRVVCTARLARVKAIDDLVDATARLARAGFDVRVDVLGDGPEHQALLAMASERGVAGRVSFLGARSPGQVQKFLARSHAFALASVFENLPLAVIEALCSGLPVVATAVGGVPEIVGPEDGILVRPRDPAALASALAELALTPSRFDGTEIARRARARFSYETVGSRLEPIYANAMTDRIGPRTKRAGRL